MYAERRWQSDFGVSILVTTINDLETLLHESLCSVGYSKAHGLFRGRPFHILFTGERRRIFENFVMNALFQEVYSCLFERLKLFVNFLGLFRRFQNGRYLKKLSVCWNLEFFLASKNSPLVVTSLHSKFLHKESNLEVAATVLCSAKGGTVSCRVV